MQKAISFKGLRNLMMLAVLATIIFATACKKNTPNIPAPATADELIGTKWEQLPVNSDVPLTDKDTRIFSFKENNIIEVTTKDNTKNPLWDYFWNRYAVTDKITNSNSNTSSFEYSNGEGKFNDTILGLPFFYSFNIKNGVLTIKRFTSGGGYSVNLNPQNAIIAKENIKNSINNPSVLVFQNGKILTDFNSFDDKQDALITTPITTTKFKNIP